ncbi:MAG: TonB family protein [Sulfurimonas sp.]|jgi:protein TonB|nr:TonB family protein [Sulfurimonas sp.]MDD3059435.1 TonB family protein [Sulfurimonas sp.]MDD5201631.1 TonB family protein [Sulfurimonas sp.]
MSQKKYSTAGRGFLAFLVMLLGGLLMIILVISFNKSVQEKEPVVKKEIRQIKAEQKQKQADKPKPKPKPKPKASQPKAPLPNMNSILGGVSMNIPEFETKNIAGDATTLLEEVAQDSIMDENTVDVKPKVLSRSPLEYPAAAAKDAIKGYVVINLLIAKDGSVELAKILESSPSDIFDTAALNAVHAWRFSPAMYKGKPVKMWAKQKIRFE